MNTPDLTVAIRLIAQNQASGVLAQVANQISAVNEAAKRNAGLREFASNMGMISAVTAGAGAAMLAPIAVGIKAAADLQTEMTHIATAMDETGAAQVKNLAEARKAVLDLSEATGISAIQEGQAYYIARSNMLSHAQALAATRMAGELTIATTQSLNEARSSPEPTTRMLTTLYANFGDKSKSSNDEMQRLSDVLARMQTQNSFRSITEVNEAMQYAAPLAKAAGIELNDAAAALTIFSKSGLHGAQAGTGFGEVV